MELPKAVVACMELLNRRKHGLITDDEWKQLCCLQTHIDDFKKNLSYPDIELMAMGASQFSRTDDMFDKEFVAAMYARVSLGCTLSQASTDIVRGTYKRTHAYHAVFGSTGNCA